MIKVYPGPNTLNGFDISSYQPQVDWSVVSKTQSFVMIKATEGASIVDKRFAIHWANAKAAGLRRIAYHFYHPSQDIHLQANNFLRTVGPIQQYDGLMIDWEADDNEAADIDSLHGQAFRTLIAEQSGLIPFEYGSPYFLEALNLPSVVTESPLVIADYETPAPLVPPPWTKWAIWQNSGSAMISGVEGVECDSDIFNGTKEDLDNLLLSYQN